jgi:hypothetical protein
MSTEHKVDPEKEMEIPKMKGGKARQEGSMYDLQKGGSVRRKRRGKSGKTIRRKKMTMKQRQQQQRQQRQQRRRR